MNKLFGDLKTDEEKSAFFLSGRGYETGVIAAAIQNDVAMAYHRCAEYKKELAALQAECAQLRTALVVELPERIEKETGYSEDDEYYNLAIDRCKQAIEAAGVRVKP